jgi:hypothetical protein
MIYFDYTKEGDMVYKSMVMNDCFVKCYETNRRGHLPLSDIISNLDNPAANNIKAEIELVKAMPEDTLFDARKKGQDGMVWVKINRDQQAQKIKLRLPKLFPGSVFNFEGKRIATNANFVSNSGLVLLDIDEKDNIMLDEKMKVALLDPYSFIIFKSISGKGYKIIVKTKSSSSVEEYNALARNIIYYFTARYDLDIDKSSVKPTMGTYLSYDTNPFINKDSKVFVKDYPAELFYETGIMTRPRPVYNYDTSSNVELTKLYAYSGELKRNLSQCSYDQWLTFARALYNTYGAQAKDLFISVSNDPVTAETKYNGLKNSNTGGANIGSVMHFLSESSRAELRKKV